MLKENVQKMCSMFMQNKHFYNKLYKILFDTRETQNWKQF